MPVAGRKDPSPRPSPKGRGGDKTTSYSTGNSGSNPQSTDSARANFSSSPKGKTGDKTASYSTGNSGSNPQSADNAKANFSSPPKGKTGDKTASYSTGNSGSNPQSTDNARANFSSSPKGKTGNERASDSLSSNGSSSQTTVTIKANFLPSPSGRGIKGEGKRKIDLELLNLARCLRKSQTTAEGYFWSLVRNRRLAGFKFRRQYVVSPYVLDFYCHQARLAIELDGGRHNDPVGIESDQNRSAFLSQRGIRVLRFWNDEVFENIEGVLLVVLEALYYAKPSVRPSPRR
ncbi:MAG: endonuclease domain-containing protein [Candidatus Zixiibacteriota bacterium]